MIFDIIIVGAGPGGTASALTLAGSGLKVALLDKASFPRDKICGDALSGKVTSVLKYISPDFKEAYHQFPEKIGSWGIRFVAPNRQILDIPFKASIDKENNPAPGFVARRMEFDHFLFEQAAHLPEVTIFEDFYTREVELRKDKVIVRSEEKEIVGKLVIGADGAHSIVNKTLGGIKVEKDHYSAGLRAYYQGVTGFQEDNFIELHFIKGILPGYFWIFPLPNGMANVGLGMLTADVSKYRINLKEKMKQIIEEDSEIAPRFAHAKLVDPIRGFGLPLGSKKRRISGERFMLVGDAASLIDPFSGEGIGNAMLSGKKAAEQAIACFQKNDFSAEFLQNYDKIIYKKIWSELNLSHKMQKLLKFPWLFNFVANKANRNPSLNKMFTMMFDDLDMRKELSKPGFYWNLLLGK